MKFNLFNPDSAIYPFRWLIIVTIAVTGWVTWADLSGSRIMNSNSQEQWSSSGPGYHK